MNPLRRERTRDMYVDIACELIRAQGVSAVTIRNVSDKAGYNSATLYSYFDNLQHLLLCAQIKFEDELMLEFKRINDGRGEKSVYDVWPEIYSAMAEYYLNNPNIFDCSFVAGFAGGGESVMSKWHNESLLANYVVSCMDNIALETGRDIQTIIHINDLCFSLVAGMVLLCVKKRTHTGDRPDIAALENDIRRIIALFINNN